MATLRTSCGQDLHVDDHIVASLPTLRWNLDADGYARARVQGKTIRMHRLVVGAEPRQIVDHINRNRLDNRRENLRVVDQQTNAINRGKSNNSASRYKGVNKHKSGWQVYVGSCYVGLFKSEEDAALAYDIAAIIRYRDLAVTNRILGLL